MVTCDNFFIHSCRGPGYCRASTVFPPTRFVSAQLTGGLKILYKHLGDTKNIAPLKEHGKIKIIMINTSLMIQHVITNHKIVL